jgi:hypothetical protein
MANSASRISISRLVLVPTLVTLGVTLLRLLGNCAAGRVRGSTKTAASWESRGLPPTIGVYFAWKLWREDERIERIDRAFLLGPAT